MHTNKCNRDSLKSGSPSPVEMKKPNMALGKNTNSSEVIDITALHLGALGEQGVLYDVLLRVCNGINSVDRNTKGIKRSVDRLYNKMDDINKHLEVILLEKKQR